MTLLDLADPSAREHVVRCEACKHTLRTPESRQRGLGPDCASKLGLAPRTLLRLTGVPRGWDCEGQTDLFEEDAMTTVYVTGAGDAYHSTQHCRDLNAGQQSGAAQGHNLRPIEEMTLDEAIAAGKDACGTCGGTP